MTMEQSERRRNIWGLLCLITKIMDQVKIMERRQGCVMGHMYTKREPRTNDIHALELTLSN